MSEENESERRLNSNGDKNRDCGTQLQLTLERHDDSCETPPD